MLKIKEKLFFVYRIFFAIALIFSILLFFIHIINAKECDYYGTIAIENPNTENPKIVDTCKYTKTITIRQKDCEKVSGDFDEYNIRDIPQCRYVYYALLGRNELINPEVKILEEEAKKQAEKASSFEEEGKCEISSAIWDVQSAMKGDIVTMLYKTKGRCDYDTAEFLICEDDFGLNLDCLNPLSSDDFIEVVKDSIKEAGGGHAKWTVKLTDNKGRIAEGLIDLNPEPFEFYFKVFIKKNGRVITSASSNLLIVTDCLDDALLLCQGEVNDKAIYGVTDSLKYKIVSSIINEKKGQITHILIENQKYKEMDFVKCNNLENNKKGENYEKYLYIEDEKYKNFIKKNFGNEPFFKKYSQMYGEDNASYIYCYKTDLKDTKACKEAINYGWYSLENTFPLLEVGFIEKPYIDEVKKWNFYQDIDEKPSEKILVEDEKGKSSWTKIFTATPKLQDNREHKNWTLSGNGTVYIGAGFEFDTCTYSCDATQENDAFEGCKKECNSGEKRCSECYADFQGDKCNKNPNHCWKSDPNCDVVENDCGKICKVDAHYSDTGIEVETKIKIPNVKISGAKESKSNDDCTSAGGICKSPALCTGDYGCYTEISGCELEDCCCIKKTITKKKNELEVEEISENVKIIKHPAFNITERGNLNFKIEDASFDVYGSTYIIKRIYKPETNDKKFIVNSDIVFNYELLEEAEELKIDVENTYVINIVKDIYTVSCIDHCCETNDEGECIKRGNNEVVGCYLSNTETEKYTEKVKDSFTIEKVHKLNITSTAELNITGIIDKIVNDFGEVEVFGALEIFIAPDILGGFTIDAKNSGIYYRSLIYPTKHLLFKKKSSPPEKESNLRECSYESRFCYNNKEFNFPEQCKKICPDQCKCPSEDILKPECINFKTGKAEKREDCVCLPTLCFPNPCTSNRTYHEEEGSFIVNGDFEQDKDFWIGDGTISLGGNSGKMLKLNGRISQNLAKPVSSQPYGELCLEFKVNDTNEFKIILSDSNKKVEHLICSQNCKDIAGWTKKCFEISGNLSAVELLSDGETFIDNVNLGKFYDFINFETYNISEAEYKGVKQNPFESLGLFSVDDVIHDGNYYTLTFDVTSRKYMNPKTGEALIYTLTDGDILNTTLTIYTFFKNETFSLFPDRKEKNLYVNVTLRNATLLKMEYYPKVNAISYGTRVSVYLNLSFYETGMPIANEKIYLSFLDIQDIWKLNPEGLKKEIVDGEVLAYVITDEKGIASFSFIPERTTTIQGIFLGNERASPAIEILEIPVIGINSPFLKIELFILLLIFYIALFSYRFFKPKRLDIYHWWEEFKGKRI
ncbi:MAG: hypothetical protein QW802_03540 [Candidatus Altiarchaeota archaeon]